MDCLPKVIRHARKVDVGYDCAERGFCSGDIHWPRPSLFKTKHFTHFHSLAAIIGFVDQFRCLALDAWQVRLSEH